MANISTVDDLIKYALFRAGEFTAGSLQDSDFYSGSDGGRVLSYINDVLEGLILGSPLGLVGESGQPLPAVDWWWARKEPQGTLTLEAPIETGTVSITQGQTVLTFSTLITGGAALVGSFVVGSGVVGGALDFTGYRIRIGTSAYLPRIASTDTSGATTVVTLDQPWPDTTVSGGTYTLFKLEYDLASDFARFAGEPTLSVDPWRFPVIDADALDVTYPISSTQGGTPRAAALISPQRIRLSHYPLQLDRVEYPYIAIPEPLTPSSTDLLLPPHYRRILAVGAAYYIAYDKADNKAGDLRQEFSGLYRAMLQDHIRMQRRMSRGFGSIPYRMAQYRSFGPLRTESGLIIGR